MKVLEKAGQRIPEYPVNDVFLNRWSPRAMSGEELEDAELFSLFEAAKWAPSSYNNQSWRFLYAKRGEENWELFYNLLRDENKAWARNAAVLVVILSKMTYDHD